MQQESEDVKKHFQVDVVDVSTPKDWNKKNLLIELPGSIPAVPHPARREDVGRYPAIVSFSRLLITHG